MTGIGSQKPVGPEQRVVTFATLPEPLTESSRVPAVRLAGVLDEVPEDRPQRESSSDQIVQLGQRLPRSNSEKDAVTTLPPDSDAPLRTPSSPSDDSQRTPSIYEQAIANPNAESFGLGSDCRTALPMLWDDLKSLATWQNAAVLGVAGGGAYMLRETGTDNDVRAYTLHHENRWGSGDVALRQFGDFAWQIPVIAGIYGYSLWRQDSGLHDYSRALIDGYAINAAATMSLKAIIDTHRPTDNYMKGNWGFPSYHTSSLFAIGGVTDEYYGWQAGLPIYVLGGLVGWSRIDQREHDLSDVLFGAVLGYVIGKSVGHNHREKDGRWQWQIQPYVDPQNGVSGVTMETRF